MNHHPDPRSVRAPSYLHEHMFPSTTTEGPARRSLSEFLRDALGTAIEFATLGEATIDTDAAAKVRFVRAEEAVMAPVPLPSSLFGEAFAAHRLGDHPALTGRGAAAPTAVAEHPHHRALARPVRPRRPGAVPPRAPVCTAPAVPAGPQRQPSSGSASSVPPVADRHLPRS